MSSPSTARARASVASRALFSGALVGAVIVASLAISKGSNAADPAASAEPSTSPSAAASAAASASAAADAGPPPPPRFDVEPFSEEKSAKPTLAEWKPTTPVALTEPEQLSFGCNAYRVREWVKIRCSNFGTSMIAMLTGAREDVMLFVDPQIDAFIPSRGGEIIIPVRRGDARIFEWSTFGEAYEGPGFPEVAFIISESWAPDEEKPSIIVHKL